MVFCRRKTRMRKKRDYRDKRQWERSIGFTATQIPKIWTFLQSSTHHDSYPSDELSVSLSQYFQI